jgi:hypothetical protein
VDSYFRGSFFRSTRRIFRRGIASRRYQVKCRFNDAPLTIFRRIGVSTECCSMYCKIQTTSENLELIKFKDLRQPFLFQNEIETIL